ncbi:MAG: hypothetical protein J2P17_19645 [Mycobacterium sp.]|nr:hypothetical protein [Mycobacterium sp.]
MGLTVSQLKGIDTGDVEQGGKGLQSVAAGVGKANTLFSTKSVGALGHWQGKAKPAADTAGTDLVTGAGKICTALHDMGGALLTFAGGLSDAQGKLAQAERIAGEYGLTISDQGVAYDPVTLGPYPTISPYQDQIEQATNLASQALSDADKADAACAKSLRLLPAALAIAMTMYRDGSVQKFTGYIPPDIKEALDPNGPRTPESCAEFLNCTVADFDHMSIADRDKFYQEFKQRWALRLGAPGGWENIKGVLQFFQDNNLGQSGSWVSWVDASILNGLETGAAMSEGLTTSDGGNTGAEKWETYLNHMREGDFYKDIYDQRKAWSEAEQAATDYGVSSAAKKGLHASFTEEFFWQPSQAYRWTLRNLKGVEIGADIASGSPLATPVIHGLIDWATDPTNSELTHDGADFAYGTGEWVEGNTKANVGFYTGNPGLLWDGIKEEFSGGAEATWHGMATVGDAVEGTWHKLFG